IVLIIAGIITNYSDSARVTTGHEPKCCIKVVSNDGSKVTYWGLGYKVVRYVGVSPNEPYESNIGVKMGSWFMKYELPKADIIKIEYEGQTITITDIKNIETIENILVNSKYNNEICDGINTHKITMDNEIYYLKESCQEIQKGDKQAKISKEDLEKINNIIYNKMDNEQSEEGQFFYGKVVESTASYIIVEPNESEEERKSADKISIGLGEYNDALYMVGTNVKITYDGTIMESYPAQIIATKIELKSAENFEILFYDKQPQSDIKVHKIVDKNETDKYDYDVYGYDGSVNIRIDGKDYSLKEALLENKITMEEIIVKANQDEKDGKIKADMYKDGGSMEYHYENYTIIKCHTVDGNRDVYIGTKDLKLTDVI
ncbi:MAG: DUF3221 domain-containing protein, partial [Clostridia bacterium]|nr:DUF3221 domain-containing protein [Clostridia bacterium]